MWDSAATQTLGLSIRVAAASTIIIVLIGTPLALWISRRKNLLSRSIEAMCFIPFVIPPVATGYILLLLLSPRTLLGRWLESLGIRFALDWKGAVVASTALAFPLFLAVAKASFDRVDKRLEDAAKTLNASAFRAFSTITLPLALPGLIAAAALAFARAFGEFGATMMLAGNIPGKTRTVPQAIYTHLLVGRESSAWMLVVVSIAVGLASMLLAQWLTRRNNPAGASENNNA